MEESSYYKKGSEMKATENKEPVLTYLIEVSAEQLRQLADRIDSKSKSAMEGQHVLTPFAENIMLSTIVHKKNQNSGG